MISTANKYPATEENTTLKDKPTFVSCFKSDKSVFIEVFISEITIEFIVPLIECKDIL
jgi:hypothetical protein